MHLLNSTKSIISITSLLLLSGCALPSVTPPKEPTTDFVKIYHSDYDNVWNSTVDWFANNNIPIKNIEKDSGIISSEYALGSSFSQLDCGIIDTGDMYIMRDNTVTANINIIVRNTPNGVKVKPNVFGSGSFVMTDVINGVPRTMNAERCVTTGQLEEDLSNYISGNI